MQTKKQMPIKIFSIAVFLAAALFSAATGQTAAQNFSSQKSYNLSLAYDGKNLAAHEVVLEDFAPFDRRIKISSGWECRIIDVDGNIIESFKFALPAAACQNQNGCAKNTLAEFDLNVPYYPQGAAINIFDSDGNYALSIDTVKFAQLCGDKICEKNENRLNCAADCRSGIKDGVCDKIKDGVCDADCVREDFDCPFFPGKESGTALIFFLAAVSLAAAGFIFWKKRVLTSSKNGQ